MTRFAASASVNHVEDDSAQTPNAGPQLLRVMGVPKSLVALICVALGFCAARWLVDVSSVVWLGVALGALSVCGATRGWVCKGALAVATLALAGGWFTLRVMEEPADGLALLMSSDPLAEPAIMSVQGVIEDWPQDAQRASGAFGRFDRDGARSVMTVRAWRVEGDEHEPTRRVSGRLTIRVGCAASELPEWVRPGGNVRVTGKGTGIREAMNPGEPAWRLLARQEGKAGTLTVESPELIEACGPRGLGERAASWWYGALGKIRTSAFKALPTITLGEQQELGDTPPVAGTAGSDSRVQARALLGAMLFGERTGEAGEAVNEAFMRLGLLHLVAISGFNLAVMGGVALFLFRLGGDRGWIEPAALALLVILYMIVLPAQAPIIRSGLMVLVLLGLEATGRRYHTLSTLGWIAAALLAWRPLDLFSPGFQLSFGIVGVLMSMGEHVRARMFGVPIKGLVRETVAPGRRKWWGPLLWHGAQRAGKHLVQAHIATSFLAWAVALPIIAMHTGLVSPLAAVTSLIVLPLTVVLMWAGYAGLLLGLLLSLVGIEAKFVSVGLECAAQLLVDVVMWMDRWPGVVWRVPEVSSAWCIGTVCAVLYVLWRGHARDVLTWVCVVVVTLWTSAEVWGRVWWNAREPFRMDTLAVGDGTCHLLRSRGEAMLWDCGSLWLGVGEKLVPRGVRALGGRRVETVLITHAHIDHFSGVLDVIEPLGVKRVVISGAMARAAERSEADSPLGVLIRGLASSGVEVRVVSAGDALRVGSATIDIVWPPADGSFRDPNDASLVGRVSTMTGGGERRVLLMGDASREAVPRLLTMENAAERLHAHSMELPHHGAFLEAKAELVTLVDPAVVVQSTGRRRAEDGRWRPTLAGRQTFITARDGAIEVRLREDGTVQASTIR